MQIVVHITVMTYSLPKLLNPGNWSIPCNSVVDTSPDRRSTRARCRLADLLDCWTRSAATLQTQGGRGKRCPHAVNELPARGCRMNNVLPAACASYKLHRSSRV